MKARKTRSFIELCALTLLIAAVALLALNGLQIGKYILKPVGRAIGLEADLGGGLCAEFSVAEGDGENRAALLEETLAALRARLEDAGLSGAGVSALGEERILIEVSDAGSAASTVEMIGATGRLEVCDAEGNLLFDGGNIRSASVAALDSSNSEAGVAFELDSQATSDFAAATRGLIGQSIYIYLDDELISAPTIDQVISTGTGVIPNGSGLTGSASFAWARNLALLIRSGELPLELELVQTREISASLGEGAARAAVLAGAAGLVLALGILLLLYRVHGAAAALSMLIFALLTAYALGAAAVALSLQTAVAILLGALLALGANLCVTSRFLGALREGRTAESAARTGCKGALRPALVVGAAMLLAAAVLLIRGGEAEAFALALLISALAALVAAAYTKRLLKLICLAGAGAPRGGVKA